MVSRGDGTVPPPSFSQAWRRTPQRTARRMERPVLHTRALRMTSFMSRNTWNKLRKNASAPIEVVSTLFADTSWMAGLHGAGICGRGRGSGGRVGGEQRRAEAAQGPALAGGWAGHDAPAVRGSCNWSRRGCSPAPKTPAGGSAPPSHECSADTANAGRWMLSQLEAAKPSQLMSHNTQSAPRRGKRDAYVGHFKSEVGALVCGEKRGQVLSHLQLEWCSDRQLP